MLKIPRLLLVHLLLLRRVLILQLLILTLRHATARDPNVSNFTVNVLLITDIVALNAPATAAVIWRNTNMRDFLPRNRF